MKTRSKTIILIAIAAILVIGITACTDPAGNGRRVPVRMAARDNQGININPSISMARNLLPSMNINIDEDSFLTYNDIYSSFGGRVDFNTGSTAVTKTGYTPDKFTMAMLIQFVLSDGSMILGGAGFFDFTNPQIFTIDQELEEDITVAGVILGLATAGIQFSGSTETMWSEVQFNWTGNPDLSQHIIQASTEGGYLTPYDITRTGEPGVQIVDDKISIQFTSLEPGWVNYAYNRHLIPANPTEAEQEEYLQNELLQIIYGGDTLRLLQGQVPMDTIIPETSTDQIGNMRTSIVVPFTPITIPSGANSITFEVSWDLTNLIERYAGHSDSLYDDVFVFKNEWWEGLRITASVQ